jgi:hypothetical protein
MLIEQHDAEKAKLIEQMEELELKSELESELGSERGTNEPRDMIESDVGFDMDQIDLEDILHNEIGDNNEDNKKRGKSVSYQALNQLQKKCNRINKKMRKICRKRIKLVEKVLLAAMSSLLYY